MDYHPSGVLPRQNASYAGCQSHGRHITSALEFADRDAAKIWIIDNQKGRRNIAEIDRIALTAVREEITARKAKKRQVVNLMIGNAVRAKLPKREDDTPINTRRESAKAAGVGA